MMSKTLMPSLLLTLENATYNGPKWPPKQKNRGWITYNGQPHVMNQQIGFVTQNEALYPHLTVGETLLYSAQLRLPGITNQRVTDVLNELKLIELKDRIIGGPTLKGIIGVVRKKVLIAQEILTNPSLLFLDETLSGLDPTTLKGLATVGRTVVVTVRQASSHYFYTFDKVILLSDGSVLYTGKATDTMGYFKNIGFAPHFPINPIEHLLDLANGTSFNQSSHQVRFRLLSTYKSTLAPKLTVEVQETDNQIEDVSKKDKHEQRKTTWWRQAIVLLKRAINEKTRETFEIRNIAQILVPACLSGLLWWHCNVVDQPGLLFFTAGFWGGVSVFQTIFTFPLERELLAKERFSRIYSVSSYLLARTLADIPIDMVLPTIFCTIIYLLAGLKPSLESFLYMLATLLLSVLVSQDLGRVLGSFITDIGTASMIGSVLTLSFTLVGGFSAQKVPNFISWAKYVSIPFYTNKLLLGSQYEINETYGCGNSNQTCLLAEYPTILSIGLDNQILSVIVLVLMLVLYKIIAYLAIIVR